jgi:hypothetical protein
MTDWVKQHLSYLNGLSSVLLVALSAFEMAICSAPDLLRTERTPFTSETDGRDSIRVPEPPPGWPSRLELGITDPPRGAAAMRASIPFGFRYHYLAGGANTGGGWATWNPDGSFVTQYVQDSVEHGIIPVFSYYMIFQSAPGRELPEYEGVRTNLKNRETMAAYLSDVKTFFQRAGAFDQALIVLHMEPDMWGYMEQYALDGDASSVAVQVAATGLPELEGLPDTATGLAQALMLLRNRYAPNVLIAYHVSEWGGDRSLSRNLSVETATSWMKGRLAVINEPPDRAVQRRAARAAEFYFSLQTRFDLVFAEFSDRDAGFYQYHLSDGAHWWNSDRFGRHAEFLSRFTKLVQRRIVLWQIPLGNTQMRALDNTWGHYQDNRVEWLLDDPSGQHLEDYIKAGVIALLFGGGAPGTTCACDAAGDDVTNPAPVNGNTHVSISPDDDGGFFRLKSAAYYWNSPLPLPSHSS